MAQAFTEIDGPGFEAARTGARGTLVLTYFWGPECPNCEVFLAEWPKVAPLLPDAAEGLVLLKLNAYDFPEAATRFGLFGIPAFLFFHQGQLLGKMSEYRGARFFASVVREQLDRVKALAAG